MCFNHKIRANSEIRTFALPKIGGTNPLVTPTSEGGGGGLVGPLILRHWMYQIMEATESLTTQTICKTDVPRQRYRCMI